MVVEEPRSGRRPGAGRGGDVHQEEGRLTPPESLDHEPLLRCRRRRAAAGSTAVRRGTARWRGRRPGRGWWGRTAPFTAGTRPLVQRRWQPRATAIGPRTTAGRACGPVTAESHPGGTVTP